MKTVIITTDGACSGNPGHGGWAAVLRFGTFVKEISGSCENTTNNRMEFKAMIEALNALKEPCEVSIRSDSGCAIAWAEACLNQGGKAKKLKLPYEYRVEFRKVAARHKISLLWVRGHNGDWDNERCDELAVAKAGSTRKDFRSRPFSTPEAPAQPTTETEQHAKERIERTYPDSLRAQPAQLHPDLLDAGH